MIQNKETGTIVNGQKNRIGKVDRTIFDRKEDQYKFVFENGYTLIIQRSVFLHHTLIRMEDGCIYFEFNPEPVLSGLFTYSLFETYGFPLEFAVDEMKQLGLSIDEAGYHVLETVARERNKNTYKNKNAFG